MGLDLNAPYNNCHAHAVVLLARTFGTERGAFEDDLRIRPNEREETVFIQDVAVETLSEEKHRG